MKTRCVWLVGVVVSIAFAGGCDQRAALDRLVPAEEAAIGRQVFAQLQKGEFEAVEAMLSPALSSGDDVRAQLEAVARTFPLDTPPKAIRIVGAMTNIVNGERSVALTYEYEYPQQWMLAQIVLHEAAGRQVIAGLHVQPTAGSQEALHAFTLRGKQARHYAMLTGTIAVPVFVLGTFVALLRTNVPRRRWLWAIAVLFGVGQVSLNWTTGDLAFQPMGVAVLGAGFFKAGPYGPVTLMCLLPVGAIAFWWRRGEWVAHPPLQPSSGDPDAARG